MKAKLEHLTVESMTMILDWAKAGEGLITERAPLVAQEIVTYGRVANTVALAILLAIAVCVILGSRWGWRVSGRDVEAKFGVFIATTFVALLWSCMAIPIASECALAWFAPRLYVIQYLSDLVK